MHRHITRSRTRTLMVTLGATLLTSGCETPEGRESNEPFADDNEAQPSGVEIFRQSQIHDGEALTFIKYVDADAKITGVILDAMGEEVDPAAIQYMATDLLDPDLRSVIDQSPHDAEIEVVLGLVEPSIQGPRERTERGHVQIDNSGYVEIELDGVHVTAQELEYSDRERAKQMDAWVAASADARREQLRELGRRKPGFTTHSTWRRAVERGDASVILPLRADEIEDFAEQNADLVAGIDLHDILVDDVENYCANNDGADAWLRLRPPSLEGFRRAYRDSSVWWYEGPNGAFNTHDSVDAFPNNAAIDALVSIDAAKTNVRVAVDWLTRGLDLDVCVIDPQGVTVACSASLDQPFELIAFDPTISGTYRIRITRFSNADLASKFQMSLAVDSN